MAHADQDLIRLANEGVDEGAVASHTDHILAEIRIQRLSLAIRPTQQAPAVVGMTAMMRGRGGHFRDRASNNHTPRTSRDISIVEERNEWRNRRIEIGDGQMAPSLIQEEARI